jgi:hypothetical protein
MTELEKPSAIERWTATSAAASSSGMSVRMPVNIAGFRPGTVAGEVLAVVDDPDVQLP